MILKLFETVLNFSWIKNVLEEIVKNTNHQSPSSDFELIDHSEYDPVGYHIKI